MAQVVLFDELPIRIGARGDWLHGDTPLHPRVAALFARHVVPAADGSYRVVLGRAESPIDVADTAFFVRATRLEHAADGALQEVILLLSDGATEPLDASTLMQGDDGALYCRIVRHGLRVACRFKPADYHELALCCEDAAEGVVLCLAGVRYPLRPYGPSPLLL